MESGYEKSVDFAKRVDWKRKFDIEVWKYGEIWDELNICYNDHSWRTNLRARCVAGMKKHKSKQTK